MFNSENLVQRSCAPCQKGTNPLVAQEIANLLPSLNNEWKAVDVHHLEREFHFKNFKDGLEFTVKVGNVAESEGHHPDIQLSWGKVKVTIWTHKINGLSINDFILAAKIDRLVDLVT